MDGSKCPLKPETSSSTKAVRAIACLALAATLVASAGCKSMADPDGTDLPWGERPAWEFAPSVPQSMMNR